MSGEIQKQFLLTSKIGNGNFSTVYLAKHIQTQQIVAVKTMKNHIPIAIKEAQLLKKMNHPNVIKLYKFQKPKNKQQALIVLEYVPQNILELYQSQQYGLKQDQVKCILFQSCLGLYHIHKKGIIHRDIKPENIMINRNKAEVKLIDFGLAIEQDKCITDYVATRWYRAPENLLGTKQYTVAIDIFSLGCVIVQLYLGNPLFPGTNNIDQISKILTVIGQPSYQSWKKGYEMFVKLGLNFQIKQERKKITLKSLLSSCSEGLTKIIQKMLILNPSKRISAEQILRDSYFKDIQKIIPPHVYDQYLIDMKTNVRTSFIKEPPKAQKKNQSKQRVRFLSEEKSFGAFSSFKSSNGFSNKLQSELIKKEKNLAENLSPTKKILVQAAKRQEFSNNEGIQIVSSKKSTRSSFISNQIINNTNSTKNIDAGPTSSIKSSLEKYQKNIMKLSNSLKKIQMIKSSQYLANVQNPPAKIVPTQQILHFDREIVTDAQLSSQRSAQMLSFRGFNQPKQKISVRQSGSILYKKAPSQQQKSDKFPVKNKKVMEYLQKFQNIANHSNLQRQKLQNSRSEPVINKNIIMTRKTPGLVQINQKQASIHQTPQKHQNQISSSQSLYRLSSKQKDHMAQYQTISSTNLSQSFNNFPEQIQMVNNDNLKSRESMYASLNSPSMIRNYQTQKPAQIQLNMRPLKQGPLIKFTSMNRQMHESQNPAQNSFRSSKVRIQDETNHLSSPVKNSQSHVFFAENINSSKKFEPNPLVSSTSFSSTPSIGQSINRPIQNKIKLIAVRDNIPNNRQGQVELNSSIPNLNLIKSTSIGPMAQNPQQKNIPHYTAICSPRKVSYYRAQESSNMYQPQIQENRIYLNQEEQSKKTKFFKSMEHRQFFTKKGPPNRYSFNTNDEAPNINFPSSNLPNNVISNGFNNINGPQSFQVQPQSNSSLVHHQTTLSQLRQSITGLTQTLNQGVFLSQRSQKVNNKNININLNLNIYEKRSPRKK